MRKLLLLGAGSHAREVFWTAQRTAAFDVVAFLDETIDEAETRSLEGKPVVRDLHCYRSLTGTNRPFLLSAVGPNDLRRRWFEQYRSEFEFASVVDPDAQIHPRAAVGIGSVVMAGSILSCDASIGQNCVVHFRNTITHDCFVGDHCFLGPGCVLAGGCTVGEGAVLGAGASSIPGVTVGKWSTVGAGSLLNRNVKDGVRVAGVPARSI